MQFVDRYPLIVTDQKDACVRFWVEKLDFAIGFESTWFTWLHARDHSATIAFMTPDHPSAPPGPETFSGKGLCLEMQVVDAAHAQASLEAKGVSIAYPLTQEPFGQRRFGFCDPSGLWIDMCEQCAPAEGYWERYAVPA